MNLFKSRRTVILVGVGATVAVLVCVVVGAGLLLADRDSTEAPAEASQGGLVVQTGRDDDTKLDEHRPLRCFVGGQLVGELTVSDCAHRNGVAPGALDVGLDQNGALAGANGLSVGITPLPPEGASSGAEPGEDATVAQTSASSSTLSSSSGGRVAGCWRYGESEWTREPDDETLAACVEALYADQCDPVSAPDYGRWADRTLRLVAGRIEISPDNRSFHVFAPRPPGCPAVPKD